MVLTSECGRCAEALTPAQLNTDVTTWWKILRRLASGDTMASGALAHVFLPNGIAAASSGQSLAINATATLAG